MPLSDLSPNRHGATTPSGKGVSASARKLLSSAMRRSPRLRHPSLALLPGAASSSSGNAEELERLRSRAQSDAELLGKVRAVVASHAASAAAAAADGTSSAEGALHQIRSLLGVSSTGEIIAEKTEADNDINAANDAAATTAGADLDETIAMDSSLYNCDEEEEGTAALDRSDLDLMLGGQKIVLDDDDNDDDGNNDNEEEEQEQDDSLEDSLEDFAPKVDSAATSSKTTQAATAGAPSPDRPFDETPSKCGSSSSSATRTTPALAAAAPSAPASAVRLPPSSTKRSSVAGSVASKSSAGGRSSSYSMTPDPDTDEGEAEESKDLSTSYGNDVDNDDDDSMEQDASAAASSTPKTTKMVYDDDDGSEEEDADGEDEYDNNASSANNRRARSQVKKSDRKKRRKTIALREDALLRDAAASPSSSSPGGGDKGTPKGTPSSVSSKSAAGANDDDKTSPPNRKSTGGVNAAAGSDGASDGSTTSAMAHSTPASSTSGDSYSLAAKAKDSMQKATSVVYSASAAGEGGVTKAVRRSSRRRTLEVPQNHQPTTTANSNSSLSALTAPSPASSTTSLMSAGVPPSPAMSDAPPPHMSSSRNNGGCETPVFLPSPAAAQSDDLGVGSLISRGGLASVQEGEGDAADVSAAASAGLVDGDRPPLPPKRSSRRKSVLPERLRQDDVLLDPNLMPNTQKQEAAADEVQERQEEFASGSRPASVGIEFADDSDEAVAKKPAASAESQPASSAGSQPQKKRRRRSSVGGLVAGGLLSAKEIEGLSAYAESKKRSKTSTQQAGGSRKRSHEATEESSTENAAAAAAPVSGVQSDDTPPVEMKTPSEAVETTSAPESNDSTPMEFDAKVQDTEAVQVQSESVDQPMEDAAAKTVNVSVFGEEGTAEALVVANEGIPYVEPAALSSEPNSPMEQEERILVAAPSPQIQEDDDPLGLKSMISAPKGDDGSVLKEPSRPTVIRKTFSFDADAITARAIKKRIPQLFPDSSAITQPCASARLFACASIVLESSKADAGGKAKRPADQLRQVLPTLAAFVNAELISLSGETPSKADTKRKKLHFSTFDGSATMPPVDRLSGSHSHLEKNILSLEDVFKEIDSLAKKSSGAMNDALEEEIKECLDAIIFTMHHIESEAGSSMMNECAESMPFHWPAKRFIKAARTYREELEEVHLLLDDKQSNDSALRSRLGDFIGRSIRFYFRRFFDPVPLNLTNEEHESYRHVDLSGTRSRVCEIVEMVDPEGDGRDTAAADGSISSVFSYALRAIHALFAINADRSSVEGEYFCDFFSSGASQRGLGPGRATTIVLSDADLDEILADIHDVHIVLQGIKAARFLSALFHWPGVNAAVKDAGGWSKVETYAGVFESLDLEKACPEEAYFTLLAGIDMLLQRIDADAEKMAQIERTSEDNLRSCWKRFRCGTKSKAILQQNPHISTIAAYLRDGKSLSFPALAEPSEEEEEEE